MNWNQIRHQYPHQWLLVEAIKAHTEGNRRRLEELVSLASCFGPFRHSHLAHLTRVNIIKRPVEDGESAAQGLVYGWPGCA